MHLYIKMNRTIVYPGPESGPLDIFFSILFGNIKIHSAMGLDISTFTIDHDAHPKATTILNHGYNS